MQDQNETSENTATSPPEELHRIEWWLLMLATPVVIWMTAMGVFAIQEINAREATLKFLSLKHAEVLTQLARENGNVALEAERAKLSDLQTRLTILTMAGAGPLGDKYGTLPTILCDLNRVKDPSSACPDSEEKTFMWIVPLGTRISSEAILGGLIVTAALGGALLRLSVDSKDLKRGDFWRTLLRALGGGIVCYFVVNGGGAPLARIDIEKSLSPATASLFGLISGMFSNSVFKLMSEFVDAFVKKVTPTPVNDVPAVPHQSAQPAPVPGKIGDPKPAQ